MATNKSKAALAKRMRGVAKAADKAAKTVGAKPKASAKSKSAASRAFGRKAAERVTAPPKKRSK